MVTCAPWFLRLTLPCTVSFLVQVPSQPSLSVKSGWVLVPFTELHFDVMPLASETEDAVTGLRWTMSVWCLVLKTFYLLSQI